MKTLQQEYQLIKEGKGNKDHFLKVARHLFPEYITHSNDFVSAVSILKGKSLLSEAVGGVVTLNHNKPDWFKIFDTNIREAVGVKDKEEYGDQNKFTADKDVEKILKNANFDNADPKNIDNIYGQTFLLGFMTEMHDPKNADKTVDELKAIVAKNMDKDINYYHTEASFGIKGIGYKKDVIGGGDPVAPKGKYKSSGYGDIPKAKTVKEGLIKEDEEPPTPPKPPKKIILPNKRPGIADTIEIKSVLEKIIKKVWDEPDFEKSKLIFMKGIIDSDINENSKKTMLLKINNVKDKIGLSKYIANALLKYEKLGVTESKKPTVDSHLKEIEKTSAVAALESKINAANEAIETRKSKLEISESADLADMMDKGKINSLKKEIKQLEKYKMQCEKKLSKMGGKKAVVDNKPLYEGYGMSLEDAKTEAQRISKEEGVVQHVEETHEGSGEYKLSDWYDSDLTVISYQNGKEL